MARGGTCLPHIALRSAWWPNPCYGRKIHRVTRAGKWGVTDLNRIYRLEELVQGDVIFAATGVTDGTLLEGVKRRRNCITTESVVMRASTGTVRWVRGEHRREPGTQGE